ncbi:MAG: hypothetical protein H6835_17740 [Planctomycetes bacterium]|nr:hypothetical protein [Planctomycetota bacterium]
MRAALLLVVVAVLGLGTWWVLRGDVAVAPIVAPSSPLTTAPIAVTPEAERTERAPAAPVAPPEGSPVPADAPTIEVSVVDAVSGRPAPDVEVLWLTSVQDALLAALPAAENLSIQRQADLAFERFGWRTRSGVDGQVRLAAVGGYANVIARDARRYGSHFFRIDSPPAEGGHRLELYEDHTLRAHVTDASGADAEGVRVGMVPHEPGSSETPRFFGSIVPPSDANGIVTFRHVQQQTTWKFGVRRGKTVGALLLSICMPGVPHVPVQIDTNALPSAPVELQLPGCGEVHVRALFGGQTLPQLRHLGLYAGAQHDIEARTGALIVPVDAHGIARFPHVALGQQLFVTDHPWSASVPAPTVHGQVVSCTVDIAEHVYALAGNVRDASGPIPSARVHARFRNGSASFETDGSGAFLLMHRPVLDNERTLELGDVTLELQRTGQPTRRCTVESRMLKPGRNDLGDLQFVVEPLIVAGRIVFDCDGKSAAPNIERFVPDADGTQAGTWVNVDGLSITLTGTSELAIEVRGTVEPGRHRLVVQSWECLPVEPRVFALGATDVEVQVHCGHPVGASCLLREDLEPSMLRLQLVPNAKVPAIAENDWHDPSFAGSHGRAPDRPQRARYVWPGVAAGNYTLRIAIAGSRPLLEIHDIVVPVPVGGDPRLRDIDLLSQLTQLHLVLRQPADRPITMLRRPIAILLPQADEQHLRGYPVLQSELTLPVPPGPHDLLIVGVGQPIELHAVEGDVDVQLQPWPTAELTMVGSERLPDGVSLRVDTNDASEATDDQRTVATHSDSGSLGSLMRFWGDHTTAENGHATVTVANGPTHISFSVCCGRYSETLHQVTPRTVLPGQKLSVQLSYDEVHAAIVKVRDWAGK